MLRDHFLPIRPIEDLILCRNSKARVSGEIVQYLWTHQIDGIRRMYSNYKNRTSTILNDTDRSGKCFQCVAFFDAILQSSNNNKILILCNSKRNLNKWHFHISSLLEQANVRVCDQQSIHTLLGDDTSNVFLITIECAIGNLKYLSQIAFECMAISDPVLEISKTMFDQLAQISAVYKTYITGEDLTTRLAHFYDLLKFYNSDVLCGTNETKSGFLARYEPCIARGRPVQRQLKLINACRDLYIRRSNGKLNQISNTNHDRFQAAFTSWVIRNNITSVELTSDTSELEPCSKKTIQEDDEQTVNISQCISDDPNTARIYETQMSQLIYYPSNSDKELNEVNPFEENIICSQTTSCSTVMHCSQEYETEKNDEMLSAESVQEEGQPRTIHNTSFNQDERNRSFDSSATKRSKYKTLDIQMNSRKDGHNRLSRSRSPIDCQTLISREKKERKISCQSAIPSTSSTFYDLQIISQVIPSPITITGSSEEQRIRRDNDSCAELSPDLFSSFETNRNQNDNGDEEIENEEVNADEPFDLALSTTINNDIFEITKNTVFDNVLSSADDRITPAKPKIQSMVTAITPKSCCLTGIRVLIPKISDNEAEHPVTCQSVEIADVATSQNSVVVLSSCEEANDVVVLSSEDTIELTPPKRKQHLTPSTRSCLREDTNKRSKDAQNNNNSTNKAKWFSKKQSTPTSRSSTSMSCKRLNKWLNVTNQNNLSDQSPIPRKPRNLFKELAVQSRRRQCQPTAPASPHIFSDDEI